MRKTPSKVSLALFFCLPWCITPAREWVHPPPFPPPQCSFKIPPQKRLGGWDSNEDELRLQGRVLPKRFVVEPRLPLQARWGKRVSIVFHNLVINQPFSTVTTQ